jgi:drug/metabolite transporter (DMT)-like permease
MDRATNDTQRDRGLGGCGLNQLRQTNPAAWPVCAFAIVCYCCRMFLVKSEKSAKAVAMLFIATTFWGASFVAMKALSDCQKQIVPDISTWFVSAMSLVLRFGLGAAVMAVWNWRALGSMTRSEWRQGLGLGIFGGIGILFQMDGVLHTTASTSAFLTQCYCIFIPIWIALRKRSWPSKIIVSSCGMVVVGVAFLSNFNWREFSLGRGEAESIMASLFFTGQILWLDRPCYENNRSTNTTTIMFVCIALLMLPVVCATGGRPAHWLASYNSGSAIGLLLFLTLGSTLLAYWVMNYWQRHVCATHASLIYCCEPLFTSVFALFVPGLLSVIAGTDYANEKLTIHLLIGGGLITGANLLVMAYSATSTAQQSGREQLAEQPA